MNNNVTTSSNFLRRTSTLLVFVAFPTLMGVLGVLLAYVDHVKNQKRPVSALKDFVIPWLLALTTVIVISWRTNGFTTSTVKPLFTLPPPKISRRRVDPNKPRAGPSRTSKNPEQAKKVD